MMSLEEKAQEISYALMRIAVYIRRKDLRSRVEGLSLSLVEQIFRKEYEKGLKVIDATLGLIKLSTSIYEVETINARVLINELNSLSLGIRQTVGFDQLPNLETLFSKPDSSATTIRQSVSASEVVSANVNSNTASELPYHDEAIIADKSTYEAEGAGMTSIGTTIRQSAIIDKIRSMSVKDDSGNVVGCRMKDLLASFPDVSERTLRYDLQRLLSQNIIERLGGGGPASFYVIK